MSEILRQISALTVRRINMETAQLFSMPIVILSRSGDREAFEPTAPLLGKPVIVAQYELCFAIIINLVILIDRVSCDFSK
jgi:hypothetical protein